MTRFTRFRTISRVGAAIVAAWFLPFQAATAATVTLSGSASATCTYSGFSGDTNGNLQFTCTGATTPSTPSAGSLYLTRSSTSLAPGGSTTISVVRTGATPGGGTAEGTLTVSGNGGCTPSASSVFFADGVSASTPPSITITASTAAVAGSTCNVTLAPAAGTAATLGSPSSFDFSIVSTTLPPPTTAGCTTQSNYEVQYTNTQVHMNQIGQNQTGAVWINATPAVVGSDGIGYFSIVESTSGDSAADVHFAVSACPGDFSAPVGGACAQHTQYTGGTVRFSIGPKPAGTPWYLPVCELPAGTTKAYLNIRQIKRPTPEPPSAPGTPSCPKSTCGLYVNFN